MSLEVFNHSWVSASLANKQQPFQKSKQICLPLRLESLDLNTYSATPNKPGTPHRGHDRRGLLFAGMKISTGRFFFIIGGEATLLLPLSIVVLALEVWSSEAGR